MNNNFDYLTIKYNSSLTAQWTGPSLYIGSGNCQSNAITYTNAHIYVTGEADSSGKRKFLTVKYDANNGAELLRWSYQTSDSNYATSVGTDASENIFVSGYSVPDTMITARYTGWTSKYGFCPPFGVEMISSIVPAKYSLFQNYPNPFNPVTIFKFDISKKLAVKVVIYNVLGKEIEELVNAQLSPGTYAARWNGTNYPSGIYFYSLQTDAFSETKKMILVK